MKSYYKWLIGEDNLSLKPIQERYEAALEAKPSKGPWTDETIFMTKLLVQIESPFAGDESNKDYLHAALHDSLLRGEAPFASHAIYTLPGVLDDTIPEERKLGMEAGFAYLRNADLVAVYIDKGISKGMEAGIERASALGIPVEYRKLSNGVE